MPRNAWNCAATAQAQHQADISNTLHSDGATRIRSSTLQKFQAAGPKRVAQSMP